MEFVIETILVILKMIYYWIKAIVMTFVPTSFQAKNIAGDLVLVTGAGSGIGRLLSIRFAQHGCHLVLWDINTRGNEETADLLRHLGATVSAYTVDLSKKEQIYRAAQKVKEDVGEVDILVNNAGIVTGKKLLDCPDSLIQKTMEVNTMAHFWTVKAFLPGMIERNHGHLVTVASGAGLIGVAGLADYCASKFGAVGFDESLRFELEALGKDGIHTTVVCPYYISTGMFSGVKTRFPRLLPIVTPDYATDKIMSAILCNQNVLCIPHSLYISLALKGFLPAKVGLILADFLGISHSMDEFTGRSKDE
ncbi:epidermal retinol dehydrogenase 2-like [Gigantopelta aegis]|uniref:epidermal retinol dehydrogenase 2-like n=1 Tax=Gigantopelta aegis TaxID=1735272 RepID=UPI001B88A0C7|nr:epidermal retinol dehydrogenase 2-like [Gigantopelta aegis]